MTAALPASWQRVEIGEVAKVVGGGTPPAGDPANFAAPGSGTPWLTPADLSGYRGQYVSRGARDLSPAGLAASSAKLLPKGAVLFSSRAPVGYVAIAAVDVTTNQGFKSFLFGPSVDPRFAYYQLRHLKPVAEAMATGTTFKELSGSVAARLPFVVAPAATQQRIADKLDTVLARVDACRDRLARVAPLLKRFRQSVLAAATSGRLTEDWRGESASDWIRLRAEDVCAKVQSGGTPKAGFTETTGIPFLKVYNIVNQRIDFEYRPQFVHPEVHAGELAKSRAFPGDVLMNIVGPPLGKVAVLTDASPEWNINQAITLFRPSERITSGWLYVLLCEGTAVRSVLDRTKGSVGQVNISLSQCRAFEFPVPEVEEQTQIVRRVDTLFAFADRLEARLAQAQAAVDRLTPSLLAKAFRGELVPQDPADEPAAELLKRLAQSRPAAAPRNRKPRQGQPA
jgi:type I restriction enzyme S subunit